MPSRRAKSAPSLPPPIAARGPASADAALATALRASEERYKSIFEHDLTGDLIARPDGTLLVCNPAFAEIFGFASPKEAIAPRACNLARLLPNPASWPNLLRLLKRHKCVTRHACDWVRLDGTPLHIVQTLVGKFDQRGELMEVQGYLFDDTQRTRATEELARHRTRLEDVVKERTEELEAAHLQLHLADRLASIGTLAAGLGHDMNNVLLPVRARLNVLRAACAENARGERSPRAGKKKDAAPASPTRPTDPSSLRPHVEGIAKSVEYLQQLADGLHYLAQDPENTQPDDAATDLRKWWSQTGVIIAKAVPRHVRLTASLPPGLPPVSIAPHRLTQAVLNLVVNAGEAIPPLSADPHGKRRQGRVRVWARADQDADGRRWVLLGVTDNGAGMTPEVKRRAFELFFTTKSRGRGTGLGLPLVYKVATRVGGTVEIDSAVDKGTTVTMTLPAAAAPGTSKGSGKPAPIRAVVTIADGRTAAMARHVLEAAGCEVVTADASPQPGDAQVWIADAGAAKRAEAAARRKSGRVAGTRGACAKRGGHGTVTIDAGSDFDSIRAAVARALSGE